MGDCAPCSDSTDSVKCKRWLVDLFPERIDGLQNGWMLNEFFLQSMFAREIDKENAEKHRE